MGIERRYKTPNERIIFTVIWSDYLNTDIILSSAWIVPSGITQLAATNNTTQANIMLGGGTIGNIYRVTNRINTSASEIVEQSLDIEIIEK